LKLFEAFGRSWVKKWGENTLGRFAKVRKENALDYPRAHIINIIIRGGCYEITDFSDFLNLLKIFEAFGKSWVRKLGENI